jgi:hypothetical protein
MTDKKTTLGIIENKNPNREPDPFTGELELTTVYVEPRSDHDQYGPKYQPGWEAMVLAGKTFDEAEANLQLDWEKNKTNPKLSWKEIRTEAREAWDLLEKKSKTSSS